MRRIRWTPLRIMILVALALLLGIGLLSWLSGRWTPSRDDYPVQGVALSARNGAIEWPTLAGQGVDFAYLAATAGSGERDPTFAANSEGAEAAGLRHGAIHAYSLCRPADDQARLFMATVPRDNAALPPVVALAFDPRCDKRPSRDRLLSDLDGFLTAIEAHGGKPAILRIAEPFEDAYAVSAGVNRTIWLDRNWLEPDYAAHPWVLWTANRHKRLSGAEGNVEWTAVLR